MANMANRGRFTLGKDGHLVPQLPPPEPPSRPADPHPVQGPTRVGEWLLVDVRVARLLDPASGLYAVCQDLSRRGACGVVESTLVIDLLEAVPQDRAAVLDRRNWPEAAR